MSGMKKQFQIAVEDSNMANVGSDMDKQARKAAAKTEPAWEGAGQAVGVQIWRIEKFKVVPWPVEEYGNFYEGDSYIIMVTTKDESETVEGAQTTRDKLLYDIYFWLGLESSQDEQGTAAYKTVELDDLLDQKPVQHREVMMHESKDFKALFKTINYYKGGVDSGFNKVEEGAYAAKLLQVKKVGKTTSVVEVTCERDSLNHGDCFVLDAGKNIYIWKGDESSPFEKSAATLAAESLEQGRVGKSTVVDVDEGFWEKLGGEGPVKSAADAEACLPKIPEVGEGVLYKLSDADGTLSSEEVARGNLSKSQLGSDDVYLCDPGPELLVYIGGKASDKEMRAAMNTATKYLFAQSKPMTTPITMVKEGQKFPKLFADIFNN